MLDDLDKLQAGLDQEAAAKEGDAEGDEDGEEGNEEGDEEEEEGEEEEDEDEDEKNGEEEENDDDDDDDDDADDDDAASDEFEFADDDTDTYDVALNKEGLDDLDNLDVDLDEDDLGGDFDDLDEALDTMEHDASPSPPPEAPSGPSKYVPPAMRAAAKEKDEAHALQQQKLRRHVNGLLNRLGEGNLDTILGELDGLYRTYARGDVTSMLTTLVLDTVAARTQLSETIVVLYAVLITAMHRIVGVEFGAYFLQECMSRFLRVYNELLARPSASDEDKSAGSRECVNLVLLLCHMLNHKLLSAGLIYDLVRLLLGYDFSEMLPNVATPKPMAEVDIELVLRIVQSCGQQLRRDDPASLKTIAELTKERLDEAKSNTSLVADSSRARFMLEALLNLRQNKKQQQASSAAESAQRLGKYLSTLEKKRTLRTHTALQVGLRDLQDAEKKGRWWLVGAAWTGHEPSAPAPEPERETVQDETWLPDDATTSSVDVGALARSQGMNTDARRAVFSTLMTALDYKEAAQSLMQLKLNDVQRREIIRVLVHCLGSEQVYNPYYVLIGQQLAEDLPGMRITMQFVLWDYFREIGETHVGGEKITAQLEDDAAPEVDGADGKRKLVHLARAYGYWIGHQALSLNVLRPVDFTSIKANGVRFVQQLLTHALLATQTKSPVLTPAVRTRLAKEPSVSDRSAVERLFVQGTVGHPALAQGLLVFLRTHLRKKDLAQALGAGDSALGRLRWAARIAIDTVTVGSTSAAA